MQPCSIALSIPYNGTEKKRRKEGEIIGGEGGGESCFNRDEPDAEFEIQQNKDVDTDPAGCPISGHISGLIYPIGRKYDPSFMP